MVSVAKIATTKLRGGIIVKDTYPRIGTQRFVDTFEVLAWLMVLALQLLTAVEIDIVLPAISVDEEVLIYRSAVSRKPLNNLS